MKEPRTITVDHLHAGQPHKVGLFKRTLVCDYDSPEGTVREFNKGKHKNPEYKLLKTGEKVKINFSFTIIEDLEKFGYNLNDI